MNTTDRIFLIKNYLKSYVGITKFNRVLHKGINWSWLEAGNPDADETLVLLHGLAMSKSHWRHIIPALSHRYHVIAPDVPGLNFHTRLPDLNSGYEGISAYMADFLKTQAPKSIHLVGHSMAASLSISIAISKKLPVESVTLVSIADQNFDKTPSLINHKSSFADFIKDMNFCEFKDWVNSIFVQQPPGLKLTIKLGWRDFQNYRPFVYKMIDQTEKEVDQILHKFKQMNIKTLFIDGEKDHWSDLSKYDEFFNRPNFSKLSLQDCGHLPFLEKPVQFSKALGNFLRH